MGLLAGASVRAFAGHPGYVDRAPIHAAWLFDSAGGQTEARACWQTDAESGVVAFEILSPLDGIPVAWVAASNSVAGARYSIPWAGPQARGNTGFRIRTHFAEGGTSERVVAWGQDPGPIQAERTAADGAGGRIAAPAGDGVAALGVNLFTLRPGVHRVPWSLLAAAGGWDATELRRQYLAGERALHGPNGVVAVSESADGSALMVCVRREELLWFEGSVLQWRRGSAVTVPNSILQPGAAEPEVAAATAKGWEENKLAILTYPGGALDDFWVWENILGGHALFGRRTHALVVADSIEGTAAELIIQFASASEAAHKVSIQLNGTQLLERSWAGILRGPVEIPVPAGVLRRGTNELVLVSSGDRTSLTYLDSIRLRYVTDDRGLGGDRVLEPLADGVMTWPELAGSVPTFWDVTDPDRPVRAIAAREGGFWRIAARRGRRYVAFDEDAVGLPERTSSWTGTAVPGAGPIPDVVYVCADGLESATQALADWRATQGVTGRVIGRTELESLVAKGRPDPRALTDWLRLAKFVWGRPPATVVLVGDGSHDFRNYLSISSPRIPPLLIRSPYGRVASDVAAGDLDGDGWPEVGVFRLPVKSATQLDQLRSRMAAAEERMPALGEEALLVSDVSGDAGDFGADNSEVSARLSARFVPVTVEGNSVGTAGLRAGLMAGLARGPALWNYIGHGSRDRLGTGYFLASDVAGANFGGRSPLFTAMTCSVGQFDVPGSDCLAETMLASSGNAPVAIWAPTGFSVNFQAALLNRAWAEAISAPDAPRRWGGVVRDAQRRFRDAGGDPGALALFAMLGDPALRLAPTEILPARATSIVADSGVVQIRFVGSANSSYRIEQSSDAVAGPWEAVMESTSAADGAFDAVVGIEAGDSARFFRAVPR